MTNRVNTVKPEQNSVSFKIDYSSPITEKLRFDAGIKVRITIAAGQAVG